MAGLNGPVRNEFQRGGSSGVKDKGEANEATGGSPNVRAMAMYDGFLNCASNGFGSS